MKKLLVVGILAGVSLLSSTASLAATAFGCPTDKVVFFGYNEKHTKAVQLCSLGNKKFRYSFGPLAKPELQVVQAAPNVARGGGMVTTFMFKNGSYTYEVFESKYGDANLTVTKGSKLLAEIELDPSKGYVNRSYEFLAD